MSFQLAGTCLKNVSPSEGVLTLEVEEVKTTCNAGVVTVTMLP